MVDKNVNQYNRSNNEKDIYDDSLAVVRIPSAGR